MLETYVYWLIRIYSVYCLFSIATWLFSIPNCLLSIAWCLLSITKCLLSIGRCLLSTAWHLLSIAWCLLSLVCCFLSMVSCLLSLVHCLALGGWRYYWPTLVVKSMGARFSFRSNARVPCFIHVWSMLWYYLSRLFLGFGSVTWERFIICAKMKLVVSLLS